MKTKHLLTAIALPALFAACTAEELVPAENIVKDNLENRPVVGDVTLSLGDAQSRATIENYNKITFKEGDKVGVALIDVWNGTGATDPISRYNLLTQSINTNYIFTADANGSFSSEAAMVEGNYVFYYPYNGLRSRNKIVTNLPKEQALTKMADGKYTSYPSVLAYSEENGAPIAVAYDFLSTEDAGNTLTAELKQIYATPLITLENTATKINTTTGKPEPTSVTIKQIILTKSAGFKLSAPLKFADASATTDGTAYAESDGTATSIVSAMFNESIPSGNAAKKGAWTSSILNRKTDMVVGDAEAGGTSTTITLTLDEVVTVPAEGTFSFYAVVPAEDYAANSFTVTVYNGEGKSQDVVFGAFGLTAGQRYPEGEFNANEIVNADARGVSLTNNVTEAFTLSGQLVSTVDELISAIRNAQADNDDTGEDESILSIRMAGSAVINSRVANLLTLANSTKASKIVFVNEVAFDGPSINWDPAKEVEFTAGVTLNANAVVDMVDEKSSFGAVTNKGTMNYYDANVLTSIKNEGTLNLYAGLSETTTIDNRSTINVVDNNVNDAVNEVTTGAITNGNNDSKVAAEMNVNAGMSLQTTVANKIGATINNEGTVKSVANEGTIYNGSENNDDAVISAITLNSAAGNYVATIKNYGTLYDTNNAETIDMMGINAAAYITAGTGTVNNDVLAIVSNSANNTVTYTMTGSIKSENIDAYNLQNNSITQLILKNVSLNLTGNLNLADLDVKISGSTSFNSAKGANAGLLLMLGETEQVTLNVPANQSLTVNAGVVVCGNYTKTGTGTLTKNGIVTDAVAVASAAAIKEALTAGKDVVLGDNISLTEALTLTSDATIDLNGKTLTTSTISGTSDDIVLESGNLEIKNGNISSGQTAILAKAGNVVLTNCNVVTTSVDKANAVSIKGTAVAEIIGGSYSSVNDNEASTNDWYAIAVYEQAKATINTTVNGKFCGGVTVAGTAEVEFLGGSYTGLEYYGLYLGQNAKVTYDTAKVTFKGKTINVWANTNTITVNGQTVAQGEVQ